MLQRAKSFIIRRKKHQELELPDAGHLARKPISSSTRDHIRIPGAPPRAKTINFETLRQKSVSTESVQATRAKHVEDPRKNKEPTRRPEKVKLVRAVSKKKEPKTAGSATEVDDDFVYYEVRKETHKKPPAKMTRSKTFH